MLSIDKRQSIISYFYNMKQIAIAFLLVCLLICKGHSQLIPIESKDASEDALEVADSDSEGTFDRSMFSLDDDVKEYNKLASATLPKYISLGDGEKAKDIAVGGYHTVVLTEQGKVYQWGIGIGSQKKEVKFPPNIKVAKITCGDYHSLALTDNGELYTWGRTTVALGHSELEPNYEEEYIEPSVDDQLIARRVGGLLSNRKVVDMSAGLEHSIAVTDNGKVYSFGVDSAGETGLLFPEGSARTSFLPSLIKSNVLRTKKIVDSCCGSHHTVLLSEDGEVYTFGSGSFGKLGTGSTENTPVPTRVLSEHNVSQIACGGDHTLALTTEGKVFAWGWNLHGQVGNGVDQDQLTPQQIEIPTNYPITKLVGGRYAHSMAVTASGELYSWGWNNHGELGFADLEERTSPARVPGLSLIVDAQAGFKHTIALKENGVLVAFGDDLFSQLGDTMQIIDMAVGDSVVYSVQEFMAKIDAATLPIWNIGVTQMIGNAESQEDTLIFLENFGGNESQAFIGVYDGHGGDLVSKFVAEHLHNILRRELLNPYQTIEEAFVKTYQEVELELLKQHGMETAMIGSTAVTCLIARNETHAIVYTANIGDSRAVLSDGENETRLSYDHRATDPMEAERLEKAGTAIRNGKVKGLLAVTRAFGDTLYSKSKEVLIEPYLSQVVVPLGSEKKYFMVVASDGLWDALGDHKVTDEVTEWLREEPNLTEQQIADRITELGNENTSVFFLQF